MVQQKLVEGKYTVASICASAKKAVAEKTQGSTLLDERAEQRLPKFDGDELSLGKVLGRGGFCVVSEITNIRLTKKETSRTKLNDEREISNVVQDRSFMEAHCHRGKDCRYAFKILQDSAKKDVQTYVCGVMDLAVEVRFLSVLRHPNIIKMRASARSSPFDPERPFFIVLDRLYDILGTRITKWKRQIPKGVSKLFGKQKRAQQCFTERLTVAYDLANALQYLHLNRIVYRDLKPDNIGFDVRGDVKIFDFGLAREYGTSAPDAQGCYKLTADTGSPRYMSPEVALGQPYNELADVYSFAILLWQILALETPFEGYTFSMITAKVFRLGSRPKMNTAWHTSLQTLLTAGWGQLKDRPSMRVVARTIREELGRTGDDFHDTSDVLDASRKSEMSARGSSYRPPLDVSGQFVDC